MLVGIDQDRDSASFDDEREDRAADQDDEEGDRERGQCRRVGAQCRKNSRHDFPQVAAQAASQTGLSGDVLKRLLPIAATLVMGSLAKQQMRGAPAGAGAAGGGDLFGMLTPMLDRNGDGSVMDDVLGSVGRMFGGR